MAAVTISPHHTFCARVLAFLCLLAINESEGFPTFIVSFQPNGTLSTDHWMRYNTKVEGVEDELTVCQWIKLRYFSTDISSIWSYCYSGGDSETQMLCWHLFMEANLKSGGRHVNVVGRSPFWYTEAHSLKFRHRQWNHICFTYSFAENFGFLYYNGEKVKQHSEGNFTIIKSGDSVKRSSFEIGQEPDIFEGGYDSAQLFNGEISELNMWSKILLDSEIRALSDCSSAMKGDIIAWHKNNFTINEADVKDLESSTQLCEKNKKLVIFPEKTSFDGAKALCDVHGGSLAVPYSAEEEKGILEILQKHKDACLNPDNNLQEGKSVWLGMEKYNRKWYLPSTSNLDMIHRIPVNYTNWDPTRCTTEDCGYDTGGCPYMLNDGRWAFGLHWGTCSSLELCTICSFVETPIFTLKGMCSDNSQLDLSYYFITNETAQISGFDGYIKSNMSLQNHTWTLQDAGVLATTSTDHPVGRKQWMYMDRSCGMKSKVETSLTLSKCSFGNEFTCESGQCISMDKRCNKIQDCKDGSDEDACNLVEIPKSYYKVRSPVKYNKNNIEPVHLLTQISIINVDIVDTLNMFVGITFDVQLKWNDDRLSFENIDPYGKNLLSIEAANKLWLPCENIIHDNAILGQIIEDKNREIGVTPLTQERPVDIKSSVENYIYKGSETQLFMTQRFKIVYNCAFSLAKFPFDEHDCSFIMLLKTQQNYSIAFVKDIPSVLYRGPPTVNQFQISNVTSDTMSDEKETRFIFSISIHHNIMDQMLGTFLPTMLLWLLAWFTLFIDISNFSDRFVGSVTTLLVLVALLSSLNDDMPKTSYFKYVDLWFLWYISAILSITIYHIFNNHVPNDKVEYIVNGKKVQKLSKRAKVNRVAIVVFAMTTLTFDIIYFIMTS